MWKEDQSRRGAAMPPTKLWVTTGANTWCPHTCARNCVSVCVCVLAFVSMHTQCPHLCAAMAIKVSSRRAHPLALQGGCDAVIHANNNPTSGPASCDKAVRAGQQARTPACSGQARM